MLHFAGMGWQPIPDTDNSRAVIGIHAAWLKRPENNYSLHPGYLITNGKKFFPLVRIIQQQHFSPCVIDDISRILHAIIGIQWHDNQSKPQCRLLKHDPFRAVFHHHGHAIAGNKGFLRQGCLPTGNRLIHLRPGITTPLLADQIEITIRYFFRGTFHSFIKQAIQRFCLLYRNEIGGSILRSLHNFSFYTDTRVTDALVTRISCAAFDQSLLSITV